MILTPPQAENKADMIEARAKEMLADIMAGMILSSSKIPETRKVEVRIVKRATETAKKLNDSIMQFIGKDHLPDDVLEKLYPSRVEIMDFLDSIDRQIDDFLASHPVPDEVKNNNDW